MKFCGAGELCSELNSQKLALFYVAEVQESDRSQRGLRDLLRKRMQLALQRSPDLIGSARPIKRLKRSLNSEAQLLLKLPLFSYVLNKVGVSFFCTFTKHKNY
ncbi:MAG: hypothetical protein COA42_14030 [Alteromonadaceae bacterium]|nr:MAG: hypothetical protein COA42_14030 [Alteromonadaceae bacterium]